MKDNDIDIVTARIKDSIKKVTERDITLNTGFFSLSEAYEIEQLLKASKSLEYIKTGGYPEAERNAFVLYPAGYDKPEIDFISVVLLSWPAKHHKVTHRDILGAVIGLGVKREKLGDIVMGADDAYIFVHSNISEFIVNNLTNAGRASLDLSIIELDDLVLPDIKTKSIHTTISSPRLDCVLGACFNISRSKAVEYIKSGRAFINGRPITRAEYPAEAGDVFSLRGVGKGRLEAFGQRTRKDRLPVHMEKYI